MLIYN